MHTQNVAKSFLCSDLELGIYFENAVQLYEETESTHQNLVGICSRAEPYDLLTGTAARNKLHMDNTTQHVL